jgi:hypothetical protein
MYATQLQSNTWGGSGAVWEVRLIPSETQSEDEKPSFKLSSKLLQRWIDLKSNGTVSIHCENVPRVGGQWDYQAPLIARFANSCRTVEKIAISLKNAAQLGTLSEMA